MGDIGIVLPSSVTDSDHDRQRLNHDSRDQKQEINVLVTGFDDFRQYKPNPSYMIAKELPSSIASTSVVRDSESISTTTSAPICPADTRPYTINIHVYPEPVRVAYSSVATLIPSLVAWQYPTDLAPAQLESSISPASHPSAFSRPNYDFVLHIGMAAGRQSYSLESVAYRSQYQLKDVDLRRGFSLGEDLPERLSVGWNQEDVLHRWQELARSALGEKESIQGATGTVLAQNDPNAQSPAVARPSDTNHATRPAELEISSNAGRYLCEFIMYASLSIRWDEAEGRKPWGNPAIAAIGNREEAIRRGAMKIVDHRRDRLSDTDEPASQRRGKVAFLHVPYHTGKEDIIRGTQVAITAIQALVGSWQAGHRNPTVYQQQA